MISCVALERPGKWRVIGITTLFVISVLPATTLVWQTALSLDSAAVFVDRAFGSALQNSALLALLVSVVSFAVGLPLGILVALYEVPGRKGFLTLVCLPLLMPSFLWALGWSTLTARLSLTASLFISGLAGCVLVFSPGAIALVLLIVYAAVTSLSASQVDAARLAGGEKIVLSLVTRHVAAPALLAAWLGGVLTLSDPGPGQIFGLRTAASEVLTSFSALYDFTLAGRQCAMLTVFVLALALPLASCAAPRLASDLLARQSQVLRRVRHRRMAGVTVAVLSLLVLAGTVAPLVGLTLPLIGGGELLWRWRENFRPFGNTLIYAVGAGAVAVALGVLLAFCVGRDNRLRALCLGGSLALLSLPPTLAALGIVQLAARAPAWADPVLRSRLTVCLALGLRFFPVAAVLGLRAWGMTSASWALAAGIHGVPIWRYLWRVIFPLLLPALAVALLVVALLATADISTVLLLHPPGEASLPLAIFTVMANAPETLVASLCLGYAGVATGLLTTAWSVIGRERA